MAVKLSEAHTKETQGLAAVCCSVPLSSVLVSRCTTKKLGVGDAIFSYLECFMLDKYNGVIRVFYKGENVAHSAFKYT